MIRRHLVAFVAGVAAITLAVGGGVAYAYWTASARATATMTTTKVAVSTPNFTTAATKTYINSSLQSLGTATPTLTSTTAFSVVYQATTAGTLTTSISAPANDFTNKFTVRVWTVTTESSCTSASVVPTGASTLTSWSGQIHSATTPTASGTQWFCLRATAKRTDVAVAGGAQSASVSVNASLTADGWTATSTAQAIQATSAIYPLSPALSSVRSYKMSSKDAPGMCLDVSGSGSTADSTLVISWSCTGNPNQSYTPAAAALLGIGDMTLVNLKPQHLSALSGLRVGERSSDFAQILQSTLLGVGAPSNSWYVQSIGGSQYQFVSAYSGRCLTVNPVGSALATPTVECPSPTANITMTAQ